MRRIRKRAMAFLLAAMVGFVSVPISSLADEPAAELKTENALDAPAPDAQEENAEEPEVPDAGQENEIGEAGQPEASEQTDKSDGTEKQDGEITEETDINEPSEENGTVEDQTPEGDIIPESTEDGMQETVSVEGTAEEETQETSEEDTDPAEDVLILTADAGGVFVQVEALEDGALPEGCQLTAQAVEQVDSFAQTVARQLYEEGGQSLLDIRAFDIRVLDENGEEVHQLDGSVRVTLEGVEAPEGASGASVYHVSDEVSLVTALEGEITSGTVCFETDHFSVYAVAYYQSKEDGIATIAGDITLKIETYLLDGKVPDGGAEVLWTKNYVEGEKISDSDAYSLSASDKKFTIESSSKDYYFVYWAYLKDENLHCISDDAKKLTAANMGKEQPDYESNGVTESVTYLAVYAPMKTITFQVKAWNTAGEEVPSPEKIGLEVLDDSKNKEGTGEYRSEKALERTFKFRYRCDGISDGKNKGPEAYICKASVDKDAVYAFKGWRIKTADSPDSGLDQNSWFSTKANLTLGDLYETVTGKSASDNNNYYRDPIMENITVYADFEEGTYIGFNLVHSCDHLPDEAALISGGQLRYEGKSAGGGPKYDYIGAGMMKEGTSFQVPDFIPVCKDGKHVFIGWYDKAQTEYDSRLLQPGDGKAGTNKDDGGYDGPYYNRSKNNTQTLDAIYLTISVKDIEKVYDGEYVAPEIQEELTCEPEYQTDIQGKLAAAKEAGRLEAKSSSVDDRGGSMPDEGYKDAAVYSLKHSLTVTFGAKGGHTAETESTVTIAPRPVLLKSKSAIKAYDGEELKCEELEDSPENKQDGHGWVKEEGADYTEFAGQTEIGEKNNQFRYTLKEKTLAQNYTITQEYGLLEVRPRYRVRYWFNGEYDDGEDETVNGPGGDAYFAVGDSAGFVKQETKTRKKDSKTYSFYDMKNEDLVLSDKDNENIIDVYYILDPLTITVKKVWEDRADTKKRPESITVQLQKKTGKEWEPYPGGEIELKEGNGWSGEYKNIPSIDKGARIEYRVVEPSVPSGYESKPKVTKEMNENGYTFTITNTLKKQPEEKKEDPTPAPEEESSEPSESVPSAPDPKSETETLPQFFPGENDNITPNQEGYLGGIRSMTGRVLGVVNDLMKPVLGAVNTGDDSLSLAALYLVLIGASTGILVFAAVRRRRRRTQNNG